jgi:hypothetical protein
MNKHPKKQLVFVCRKDDSEAVGRLKILETHGVPTKYLDIEELAPVGSVALYTGYNEQWPSRVYRVAAHRLYPTRPKWAVTTPFLISIKPDCNTKRPRNVSYATRELVELYKRWFEGDAGVMLPWETRNGPNSTYVDLIESWLDLVGDAIGEDILRELLESQKCMDDRYKGRGGDIVYRSLSRFGCVVTSPEELPSNFPANSVYSQLTGFSTGVVSYGTSDLANVFELLQALKLGHVLGLPVVFETYPGAHKISYWLNGFLNPSLKLLGSSVWTSDLGMIGESKYTEVVSGENMRKFIRSACLENIEKDLLDWANNPLWVIYHKAMQKVADIVTSVLGISVNYALTTTEELCSHNGIWKMKAKELARIVEKAAGHSVVVFNKDDGSQLMTSNHMPDKTVEQLHGLGWWLGGAAIYYTIFSLGNYGGVVVMVKDSTAGRVNLMAKEFVENGSHLKLAPVGLFRLSADGQNEDWSIDPLVMLSLFSSWDANKVKEVVQIIWDAMEVPLAKENIGTVTMAKVTRKGVSVRRQKT